MSFWLTRRKRTRDNSYLQRFDPRFWTVNFPRPAMASFFSTAADAGWVAVELHHRNELVGLIWESEDTLDHPLLAYETNRDYSHTCLRFRWRSFGVATLDQPHGPTLTIEGRDASGAPQTWYVRLWNYASGEPTDAVITLPFSKLQSGWSLPGVSVHPADIDRMFISIVAPDYDPGNEERLQTPVVGYVRISDIACDGRHAMLELGDVLVPPHGERIATAYDDQYNQTPARVVRSAIGLGYREELLHYVGMSHFPRLTPSPGGELLVDPAGEICAPARNWHKWFCREARAAGLEVIMSISYELFDQYCHADWKQRTHDGAPALTGWVPPSTLLSPANPEAMAWLQSSAAGFARLLQNQQLPVRSQIGEPWWWVTSAGEICLYDDAARQAFGGSPVQIASLRDDLDGDQLELLHQAGTLLAQSTADLTAAIREAADDTAEILLLVFAPTILDPEMPQLHRANLPQEWSSPAFDRLQTEDYDWLTAGADALRRQAVTEISDRLSYPIAAQDYLAGFVLNPDHADDIWPRIDAGIDEAAERGIQRRFVWAMPQVARDGYTRFANTEEDQMNAFDDVLYPFALGRNAAIAAEFSTAIAVTASGHERRNSQWADARLQFDVGTGIRSERELADLLAFFRARRGAGRAFRIRDPFDHSSNGMTGEPTQTDQLLGIGDGLKADFDLIKTYGDGEDAQQRRITRPRDGSLVVSVDGVASTDWSLGEKGVVRFGTAPSQNAAVRAGFLFDVPVRFAEDRIDISGTNFAAGEAPSVPLIEVRESE